MLNIDSLLCALENFCTTVEAAGGVLADKGVFYQPVGDPEWTDLGQAYIQACEALKREAKIDSQL